MAGSARGKRTTPHGAAPGGARLATARVARSAPIGRALALGTALAFALLVAAPSGCGGASATSATRSWDLPTPRPAGERPSSGSTPPPPTSGSSSPSAAPPDASPDPFPTLHHEAIGPFRVGMSESEAIRRAPTLRALGPVVEEGATGEWVQFFEDPAGSLAFGFSGVTERGPREVRSVQISGTSRLLTRRGVGLGATYGTVIATYGDLLDPDFPPTPDTVIAGSLYGGMFFHFQQGVVSEIFLGAGAE